MVVRSCAFTAKGESLVDLLENQLPDIYFDRRQEACPVEEWVKEGFMCRAPILFVGAIGIAVRKIAPYVRDKATDSPVLVMDEKGQFVIPLLSNHLGGANELAEILAAATKGQVVLTTATDVTQTFAVDVFARKNGLHVQNKEAIKRISARLLNGEKITMSIPSTFEVSKESVPDCICLVEETSADVMITTSFVEDRKESLVLVYQPYILGIGCKKNTPFAKISDFVTEELQRLQIQENRIAGMASIDLKKKELGLLYYEAKSRIPFTTFSVEELQQTAGDFTASSFVEQITGVSNVCERAAVMLAGEKAMLIVPKIARDGMTMAVSKRKERIMTWET